MPFKDALNVMEKCSKAVNETFAELVHHSFTVKSILQKLQKNKKAIPVDGLVRLSG